MADTNTNTESEIAVLRKLVVNSSTLIDRMSWMSKAGLSHGGERDLWDVFGYSKSITPTHLYVKYRRQNIAKTIVECPADALWTRPPVVTGGDAFNNAWKQLLSTHNVWDTLLRTDYTTGFGRFGIVLIGLDDGRPLDTPAGFKKGEVINPSRILYLQPYSELGVSIQEYDTDPGSRRYGKPKFYQIQPSQTEFGTQGSSTVPTLTALRVHHSRIIHVTDSVIEDTTFGIPRLEPVYNDLVDLLKVAGGTAETYWLTANRGMQINVDPSMNLSSSDLEDLTDEIDEYFHNLRRFIRTRGIDVKELGSKVPSSKDAIETIMNLISATVRIPKRILFGSEVGSLASEQDRANWAERVQERRTKFGEPRVIAPMISALSNLGFLPESEGLKYDWPDAFVLAPLERAQTSAQKARSAANLSKVIETHGEKLITTDEARKIIGLFDQERIMDDSEGDPNAIQG